MLLAKTSSVSNRIIIISSDKIINRSFVNKKRIFFFNFFAFTCDEKTKIKEWNFNVYGKAERKKKLYEKQIQTIMEHVKANRTIAIKKGRMN